MNDSIDLSTMNKEGVNASPPKKLSTRHLLGTDTLLPDVEISGMEPAHDACAIVHGNLDALIGLGWVS